MKTDSPVKCPACGRDVPDRRAMKCGYCEAPLPPSCRFTAAQIAERKRKDDKRKKERALWSPADSGIGGAGDVG